MLEALGNIFKSHRPENESPSKEDAGSIPVPIDTAIPLPPMSMPENPTAAHLHKIAFRNDVPLTRVAQELFYGHGQISSEEAEKLPNGKINIKGVIERDPFGNLTSPPLIEHFANKD